jgi:hypothetical protein
MAVALAAAGAAEEAAKILKFRRHRSRKRDATLAGRTHAPKVLPELRFAPYIGW